METIIICLLVVAVALLVYVIVQGKKGKNSVLQKEKPMAVLPDIIGSMKDASNYSSPSITAQSKRESTLSTTDNFDNRNTENYQVSELPQEGSEVAEKTLSDWKEEEEEMARYAAYGTEDGFAQGFDFEELSSVGVLLQKEELEPVQKETAIAIVQKIQGTELFSLLENSVEDASRKIAELLDSTLSIEMEKGSSILRERDLSGFDIGDYV
ncbi:conjugal transfer protein TraD [Cyanobium sp. HWJ4-Hawea]|nr:conjugal transfer protein TraD [Cyanobium sp. HWJ4-Hawea]